jgi:hypothetical protein
MQREVGPLGGTIASIKSTRAFEALLQLPTNPADQLLVVSEHGFCFHACQHHGCKVGVVPHRATTLSNGYQNK